MNTRALFGFQGRVSRGTYALVGTLGALLKYGMDRWFAQYFLHQPWGFWSYLSPVGILTGNFPVSPDEKKFLLLLAVTSVPFIWLGIAMTLKRLRDAGLRPSSFFFSLLPP